MWDNMLVDKNNSTASTLLWLISLVLFRVRTSFSSQLRTSRKFLISPRTSPTIGLVLISLWNRPQVLETFWQHSLMSIPSEIMVKSHNKIFEISHIFQYIFLYFNIQIGISSKYLWDVPKVLEALTVNLLLYIHLQFTISYLKHNMMSEFV